MADHEVRRRFLEWCAESGIEHSVAISDTEGEGLGVVAATTLEAGASAIVVPRCRVFLHDPADGGNGGEGALPLATPHGLALQLARHADGLIAPWTATWPSGLQGGWGLSGAEWAALGWCDELRHMHDERDGAARRAYAQTIVPRFESSSVPPPSLERFMWALSHVGARAADVDLHGQTQTALVPLVDLMNHRTEPNVALSYEPGDGEVGDRFVARCLRPLRGGEPLSLCYGRKQNAELLVGYGFALHPNPHERALLRIPLDAGDDPALAMQKRAMLPRGMAIEDGRAWGAISRESFEGGQAPFARELLLLISIASAAGPEELLGAMAAGGAGDPPPAAWRLLAACCDEALGRITAPDDPGSDGPAGRIALAVAARRDLLTRAAEAARHAEAGAPLGSPTVVEE